MKITDFHHIHFTGIKGVGLTALALCAQDLGIKVSGSDTSDEFVTDPILKQRGISWNIGFSAENISRLDASRYPLDAVVYTAAHRGPQNPEVIAAQAQGITTLSYAEALGIFMAGKMGISLCGVGGKSTTAAMMATILEYANLKPSYVVGVGNIPCLGTPGKYSKQGQYFVAEADEYFSAPGFDNTPKFMYQHPTIIGVSNISYDHPDVYPDFAATKKAYGEFFRQLPEQGILVVFRDNPHTFAVAESSGKKTITFGSHPQANFCLKSYHVTSGKALCTVTIRGLDHEFVLKVPGKFNALNALCALAITSELGVDTRTAAEALRTFTGTTRRFELVSANDNITVIDDYAHHPSEIQATLKAAKDWFPHQKIVAIFQPHTYSRTKALFTDFAASFANADEAIILPIYASARESFDPSVSSQGLVEAVQKHHQQVIYQESTEALIQYLKSREYQHTVIITIGAGDIFLLGKKLLRQL